MTQAALKETLKSALIESTRENRALFADLFAEVLEDAALATAIREGAKSKPVSRAKFMTALRSKR
ncbi:MAG TPA: hypothetical protein PLD59_15095 [Tepidisphaeraceae bacterium]|nr:hypothetical protein [Tepidisphaeraceae bacterium]